MQHLVNFPLVTLLWGHSPSTGKYSELNGFQYYAGMFDHLKRIELLNSYNIFLMPMPSLESTQIKAGLGSDHNLG